MLNGKVIAQACFSNGNGSGKGVSLCPAGGNDQIGGNAAQPIGQCFNGATNLCRHGTHVASIAAGRNPNAPQGRPANGVAKDASIFAIQVFTRYNTNTDCNPPGEPPVPVPCVKTLDSDQVRGLDHVLANLFLNGSIKVASVNMSLGGGQHKDACDDAVQKSAIDHLRDAGVLTTISSGNNGYNPFVGSPGCISTAVTVGATTKSDTMSSFSNISSLVDLLAPEGSGGGPCAFDALNNDILAAAASPTATDSYSCMSGTSMAAPHVAGAIAAIRSACPFLLEGFNPNGATANAIENALKSTGLPVTIPLPPLTPPPGLASDVTQTKPRIRVDRAVAAACLLPLVVDHDFNGDGKSDILARNLDGSTAIAFMNGGAVAGNKIFGPGGDNNWQIFGWADFDGDGKSDILWRHLDGTVAIWFMDGGTKIGEAYPGGAGGNNDWKIQGTAAN